MAPLHSFNAPVSGAAIRVLQEDDQLWFVGKDVCAGLGITNSREILKRLDEDEKVKKVCDVSSTDTTYRAGVSSTDVSSRSGQRKTQELLCITESGLYHLIFTSNKPEAQAFRKWVTGEVLPALRKHGRYEFGMPAKEEAFELLPPPTAEEQKNLSYPRSPMAYNHAVSAPDGVVDFRAVVPTRQNGVPQYWFMNAAWNDLLSVMRGFGLTESEAERIVSFYLDAGLRPAKFLLFGEAKPRWFISEHMIKILADYVERQRRPLMLAQ